jgi:hypothetical protein
MMAAAMPDAGHDALIGSGHADVADAVDVGDADAVIVGLGHHRRDEDDRIVEGPEDEARGILDGEGVDILAIIPAHVCPSPLDQSHADRQSPAASQQ